VGWQELCFGGSSGVGEAGRRWSRRQGEPTPSPGKAQPGGMPSRDRGRRAKGNEDRSGVVAEGCFV